ncbi:DUF5615 family PIN-like protein [Emticicia oligotrophica]|uniref:DUF5615 family PIN-like protein n=1 Tax=Emticicia oligotrophica TaxID=312279 RepID=UPI00273B86AB|nr:DUF5615 family PIN-like protein [Emticicia oligotrophica]
MVAKLRQNGYNVLYIAESFPSISDTEVLQITLNESAILLTKDKDFGELIFKLKFTHKGIVLVRLSENMSSFDKAEIILKAFQKHFEEFEEHFSVIDEEFIRIR